MRGRSTPSPKVRKRTSWSHDASSGTLAEALSRTIARRSREITPNTTRVAATIDELLVGIEVMSDELEIPTSARRSALLEFLRGASWILIPCLLMVLGYHTLQFIT